MALQVEEALYAPGAAVELHAHARPLFAAVLAGAVEQGLRRTVHGCKQGGVFTHAGEPHRTRFGARGARLLLVHVDQELALPPVVHSAQVSQVARQLAAELRATDAAAPLAREGLGLQLLALAARAPPVQVELRWMARVQEYLEANLLAAPGLGELAAVAGVHPAHLGRAFRAVHGESLVAYVRRRRIEWAHAQLLHSQLPLADIALAAGFCDQGHFARTFRRLRGLTPGEVRRRGA